MSQVRSAADETRPHRQVKESTANELGFVALVGAKEELKMDKVVAALETSLARATEPALRAQLQATIERLRKSPWREGGRRQQPRSDVTSKSPRQGIARRRG